LKDALSYYDFLHNSVVIKFIERGKTEEIPLTLSKKMVYEEMASHLARAIQLDNPLRLRISHSQTAPPAMSIRLNLTVHEMMSYLSYNAPHVFFYDILPYSLSDLETHRLIQVLYFEGLRDNV
jgi:hypothetical protein